MNLTHPLDHAAIEKILPHRYPFLFVDRITDLDPDKRIVGIKNVTIDELLPGRRRWRVLSESADASHASLERTKLDFFDSRRH